MATKKTDTTTLLPGGFDISQYQYTPTIQGVARPTQAVLPMTPQEDWLRQYGMGQLMGPNVGQQTALGTLTNVVGGGQLDVAQNPYIQNLISSLGTTAETNLKRSVGDILSQSNLAGAGGGSREALLSGQAVSDTQKGLNQTIADLLNQQLTGALSRQVAAAPSLMTASQQPVQNTMQALGLAGQPRQLAQQNLDAIMQQLQEQQTQRLVPLQVAQSILGQQMGQNIPVVTPGSSPMAGVGSVLSGLGSLGAGASGLTSLASAAGSGLSSLAGSLPLMAMGS